MSCKCDIFPQRFPGGFTSAVLVVIGCAIASSGFAGGISVGDQGAVAAGRSGAFVAKADDPSAIEYNPAGLTGLKGWNIYLSNRFAYASERYKRATIWDYDNAEIHPFGEVSNQKPWQLLGPMLALTTDFGLKDWSFAIGAYAPAGISSQEFPRDGGQRYMLTYRDTKILYYNASVAWKLSDVFGVGLSLQWVDLAQLDLRLAVNGDVNPAAVSPISHFFDMEARVQGADHIGVSGILGMWYRPSPSFQMAFSSRFIPTKLEADATLTLVPLDEDNNGSVSTQRNGTSANDVVFSMTLPMEFRAGFRYIHLRGQQELFDVELDFRYELWSQMESYRVDGTGMSASIDGISEPVSVGLIVVPKNWKNTFSVRLGGDFNAIENRLKLRAGTFWETAAAPNEYAYVDFLASTRIGASLGASVILGKFEMALSYTYVIEVPVKVHETDGKIYQQVPGSRCKGPDYDDPTFCDANYQGQPSATVNGGTYTNTYHFTSLALSYRF